MPFAMVFPALWAMAPSRMVAAFVSAGYFLAASRGLPQGVANFYAADVWPGLLLWVAASASFVGVHAVLWTARRVKDATGKRGADAARALRYLVSMVLTGLPPFGITGWAHPLTAAGVLFPGWGWWGLFALTAGLLVMTTRFWPAAAITLGAFWLWSAATWTPLNLAEGWRSVDLQQGQNLGRDGSLAYQRDLIATVRQTIASHPDTHVIVLPESALGFWTPTVESLWREGLRGPDVTVVAGAARIGVKGYDNVMVAISANEAKILYRERMPVPVSMWQPWLRWTGRGRRPRPHLRQSGSRSLRHLDFVTDLLRAADPLAGVAVYAAFARCHRRHGQRLVDRRHVDRRHPKSECDCLGKAVRLARRHRLQPLKRENPGWSMPPLSSNVPIRP